MSKHSFAEPILAGAVTYSTSEGSLHVVAVSKKDCPRHFGYCFCGVLFAKVNQAQPKLKRKRTDSSLNGRRW
jgi:hypothetical protein